VRHWVALRTRFPLAPVALAGILSILIYVVAFVRPYPLAEWWQYALMDYTSISGYDLWAQIGFLGSFAALFGLYYWAAALLGARRAAGTLWLILLVQIGAAVPLVATYPIGALDVFDYLLYARMALYWGANPLVVTPGTFPNEPTLGFSYWPNEPSIYGPVWQALSERAVALADGQVLEGLIAFKLVALGAAVLTTVVVWLVLRRVAPDFAEVGALLWAWNPLQQFETAGNAHNDSVMVLLLVVAVAALVYGPRVLSLAALLGGLLIKITLAPLVPVFALALVVGRSSRSERALRLVVGVAVSVVLTVVAYAPYWQGRASLPFLDRGNWFTASPPTLLREAFRGSLDLDAAGQRAAIMCAIAFSAVAALLLMRLLRRTWHQPWGSHVHIEISRAGYHVFFAYLVLACLWWQPWYLLVLLALSTLAGDRALVDRTNLFCVGGLLSYVVFKYIWQIHQVDWSLDYGKIMAMSVIAIFTWPLLHLVGSASAARYRRVPSAVAAD
jgi:hypothetical protein